MGPGAAGAADEDFDGTPSGAKGERGADRPA